jgi:hypothetical protein
LFTVHDTAVFAVPETVAANVLELPNKTVDEVGETATVIGAALTTTPTELPVTAPFPGCRTAN